jgi:hypothetical protein
MVRIRTSLAVDPSPAGSCAGPPADQLNLLMFGFAHPRGDQPELGHDGIFGTEVGEFSRNHDSHLRQRFGAEAKVQSTVKQLGELYLEERPARKPNKKKSSWDTDRAMIRRHPPARLHAATSPQAGRRREVSD